MISIINFLGLKFEVTQHRWGRKLYKGTWYLISNQVVSHYWSQSSNLSCQGIILKTEKYD